jgi:Trk K+ transport system NAD-binding subunit
MAQGMSDAFTSEERVLRTIGDYVVKEVEAPAAFVGRALAALDLRGRHEVTVLVIKREATGEPDVIVPTGETEIQDGDRLLLMGRERAIRRLGGT